MAAHVVFAVRDARYPPDLNRVYTALPSLYVDLAHPSTWGDALATTFTTTTGWYNLLVAALSHLTGRPGFVFQLGLIASFALLLWATGDLARRLGGAPARAAAIALTASTPIVYGFARQGWVHVLEAAIALALVTTWAADTGLTQRRTRVGVAVGGLLLLWTRTSGLLFAASVLVALVSGWRAGGRGYFRRLGIAVAPWAIGMIPVVVVLQTYLSDKLASRSRYFAMVRPLTEQLPDDLGWAALAVLVAGVGLYATDPDRRRGATVNVLIGWVVAGFSLVLVFGVGVDNFNVIVPAAAVLAGVGFARRAALLSLIPVALFIPIGGSFWLPAYEATTLLRILPGTPKGMRDDHSDNFLRVYDEFGVAEIRALLDATCPGRDTTTCTVGVDRGLFRPSPEEPGALELFLMGETNVRLNSLAEARVIPGRLDAVARYGCVQSDIGWTRRYPRAFYNTQMVVSAQNFSMAWRKTLSGNCTFEWYTQNGRVANAGALPKGDPLGLVKPGTITGSTTPQGPVAPAAGTDFYSTGPRFPHPSTFEGGVLPQDPRETAPGGGSQPGGTPPGGPPPAAPTQR